MVALRWIVRLERNYSNSLAVQLIFFLTRTTAQGTGSTAARIGGILAPFVALTVRLKCTRTCLKQTWSNTELVFES